ncbi:hypothetical protein PQ469_22485 [Mucilaginibacter sp. KACC 22773]|uniref:hypothetical protein n=1 Tax=Mucilaginibacter sp. KACC 22773 TaxID=3025671 RepID=UPI002366D968|nr:hypothetical protein [Mucilaginibacter sp. KACC 22773]WDF76657.1 hypothetical protein PQ469_22485 [Mucilaginibacter sp. KACC 22773]
MKDLPYFLMLVKKNAILWTIITTNSFANVDLKNTVHGFWTNQCLEIRNFSLSQDEKFSRVEITITEPYTTIDFFTTNDKYLKNTTFYFDRGGISDTQSPYAIDNIKVTNIQKKLGKFDMGLELPVDINVINSSVYGNAIAMTIYKKNWLEILDKMKDIDPFEH